jgi:hypothetical protein
MPPSGCRVRMTWRPLVPRTSVRVSVRAFRSPGSLSARSRSRRACSSRRQYDARSSSPSRVRR